MAARSGWRSAPTDPYWWRTTSAMRSGASPRPGNLSSLHRGDEFGLQIGFEPLGAALIAIAALLDAAERGLGARDDAVVERSMPVSTASISCEARDSEAVKA